MRSIVSYTAVKRAYLIASPSDMPPPPEEATEEEAAKAAERHREALKKRLQRLRERLTKLNVIGVAGDRIWWTGKALRAFPQTMPRQTKLSTTSAAATFRFEKERTSL